MVRSLWTAASGMIAQQTNVDTIANNLANVNTTGYKTEKAEFKSLLYQTLQAKTTTANGENKPIPAQVGLGTRNSSITSDFTSGIMTATEKDTDFAVAGSGFFGVRGEDGNTYYTRNGSFLWARGVEGTMLTNSDGLPILNTNGTPIILDNQYQATLLGIDSFGRVTYPDAQDNAQPIGISVGLYQFNNPSGLHKLSGTLYEESVSSGQAMNEAISPNLKPSQVKQGYLEGSNVQVVDEMVNMIVAQRAYEMNSKAIQASDAMLGQANELKR